MQQVAGSVDSTVEAVAGSESSTVGSVTQAVTGGAYTVLGAHTYGWNPTVVRLVTAILAIAIPGPSLIPTLAIYVILGLVLPESEEF